MSLPEYPTITLVDLEFLRPTSGFILGRSFLGRGVLQPETAALQWVSYLARATSISVQRGGKADGVGFSAEVGTLSVTMLNAANPLTNTDIKPRTPIRLRHRASGQLLFTGYLVDINTTHVYDKGRNAFNDFVTLAAVDAVQAHANTTRYGALIEPQTFAQRVQSLSESAVAPVAVPTSTTPYQLGGTVYEGSLAAHFDMTVNTVGARWWVDVNGITQFKRGADGDVPVATFTDVTGPGLHYTDAETALDSRATVNDLNLNWHDTAVDDDGKTVAFDNSLNYNAFQAIADYGARSGSMDIAPFQGSDIDARAAEVLAGYAVPQWRITRLTWNAQDASGSAPLLELSALLTVTFRGTTGTYRIVNLSHDITPTRWIVTLNISKA